VKTPYDTALRALQREVDDLRTAIGSAADRLTQIEARRQQTSDTLRAESALAARDWTLSPEAYLAGARAQEESLLVEEREAEARLAALREQAMESYGSLRAMEEAIGVFRAEAERQAATSEQAAIDDFAGARFIRATRHARRAARSRSTGR
jgi:hypothetical protein